MKTKIFNIAILSTLATFTIVACGKKGVFGIGKKSESESDSGDAHTQVDPRPQPIEDQLCVQKKTNAELVTSLTQDLFRRSPEANEIKLANDPGFDFTKFVDNAFKSADYDTGIAHFISNLFRLEQNIVVDANNNDPNEIAIVNDLKQEPVILVQKNKDKPWSWFFTTQEIYCSAVTGPLYDYPVDKNTRGFVRCRMQSERAGFLGMVSFLRAFKSSFYVLNKNRHRVAAMFYLTEGIQLAAATNGPVGEGRPIPLAPCIPTIDQSVSSTGQIFGTAAISNVGLVCSNCHSKYIAKVEPAFTVFDMDGKIMRLTDIDALNNNMLEGVSKNKLKQIFEGSGSSCWAPDSPDNYPEVYNGVPGLGRLVAKSKVKLAEALAIQIQQNLVNKSPQPKTTEAIVKSYKENGETLQAALKGFFMSESYQCAVTK